MFYVGYRNPGLIAKAAATLDHLSGGRFELGLGAGWHEQEAAAYGYDFPGIGTRLDMLEEAVQIIRGLLTQERTTFHGTHFRVEDASNLPSPVQEKMPIWIGGVGERRTVPMVARHADGWNAAYLSPQRFAELGAVLDDACKREDRDPADVKRAVNLSFELVPTKAAEVEHEQAIRDKWGPLAERMLGGALTGTPDTAVDRILEYHAAGADVVNIALRAPWDQSCLDLYLNEVMPAVRAAI